MVTISNQPQKSSDYCAICTPARRQCLKNYPLLLKSEWSDSKEEEEEKNFDRKKGEEEIEDWDGDIQREQELQNNNNNSQITPDSTSFPDSKTLTLQLMSTLVDKISAYSGDEKQKEDSENVKD